MAHPLGIKSPFVFSLKLQQEQNIPLTEHRRVSSVTRLHGIDRPPLAIRQVVGAENRQ